MREVLDLVNETRQRAAKRHSELASLYSISEGDPPIGGLGMAYNSLVLALELLDHYYGLWGRISSTIHADPDQARRENAARVILINKMAFIQCMSGFEFSSKQALSTFPGTLPPMLGRIYLRRIIRESKEAGLVSPVQDSLWEGAIRVRNCLVHNNGIAERTKTYSYPLLTVSMTAGEMTQGNLKFFPLLTDWTVEAYADWCERFLQG